MKLKSKLMCFITSVVCAFSAVSLVPASVSAEEAVNLSDYTTDYYALDKADYIMFSGNQVLLKFDLMVHIDGCVITPDEMKWEVSGTADTSFESNNFYGNISYEDREACSYCLITANTPGTVYVKGIEYNLDNGEEMMDIYFNLSVGEDGNFNEIVTYYEPTELETLRGDVSGDNEINLYDAIEICKHIMNMISFDDKQYILGDMNSDGVVNLYDAIEIAKIIMNT